jgi:hypothetical protein
MEALYSSETQDHLGSILHYNPVNHTPHSHRQKNITPNIHLEKLIVAVMVKEHSVLFGTLNLIQYHIHSICDSEPKRDKHIYLHINTHTYPHRS